jgi:phenylpropionate dioxygenase-like ring-hydroxylating dioxygenase large terminal subunit
MFLHDTNLPFLLAPDRYHDPAFHTLELEQIFPGAFHPVAVRNELHGDGDFVTRNVLGVPVPIRNIAGELNAFVNVCAHRFCKLTDAPHGNSATLKCQYHGWEYDACGATKRIPEAQGFRPLEKGQLALRKLRVEACGELVFVALDEEGPTLAEFLGVATTWVAEASQQFRLLFERRESEVPVNWKVAMENTLESYHLRDVHAATLGAFYPEPENCRHECGPNFSKFVATDKTPLATRDPRLARLLHNAGRTPRSEYHHLHVFPHLTFGMTDMFFSLQWFEPLSVESCRMHWWLLALDGQSLPWLQRAALARRQRQDAAFWRRVNEEDLGVLPSVQAGLESRLLPRGGLLGTREERIWHFQSYVQRAIDGA